MLCIALLSVSMPTEEAFRNYNQLNTGKWSSNYESSLLGLSTFSIQVLPRWIHGKQERDEIWIEFAKFAFAMLVSKASSKLYSSMCLQASQRQLKLALDTIQVLFDTFQVLDNNINKERRIYYEVEGSVANAGSQSEMEEEDYFMGGLECTRPEQINCDMVIYWSMHLHSPVLWLNYRHSSNNIKTKWFKELG